MPQKSSRKPRRRTVEFDLGESRAIKAVGITPYGEIVTMGPNGETYSPVHATLETYYERANPKKPKKHINKTPPHRSKAYVTADGALLDYDAVIAIDTNTKKIEGNNVSMTSAVLAAKSNFPTNQPLIHIYGEIGAYEFWNVAHKPENNGWRQVIQTMDRSPCFDTLKTIGVIVDSDLGALGSYNAGTQPIIEDFYLPKRYTLLYASADTGGEFLINQLLQLADKSANRLLAQCAKETENLTPTPDATNHTHFRAWVFDKP